MTRALVKTLGLTFFCLLGILAISIFACREVGAADTIKMGMVDVFSGPFSFNGDGAYTGAKFVVDELNKKGGVLGKQIEIIKEDGEMKPDVSTRKAKKLILEDKVDFFGLLAGTHIGIALNKVAATYKTLFINYGAPGNEIMGKEFTEYAFRVCHNVYNDIAALANLMARKPYRKFYIICQDYSWGHDTAEEFKRQITMYLPDAKIVGEDYHPISHKDFAPYIAKVQASGADAIFSANWGPDLSNLIRQARSLGLKAPFPFVSPLGHEPVVLKELGDDAVGLHVSYDYMLQVNTPENKAMIEAYSAYHKNDQNFLTRWPVGAIGQVICGLQHFFAAVEKAKSLKPDIFIPVFEGFESKTAVGVYKMRKCDHQVILPMFAGEVVAGKNPYYNFPFIGPNIITIPPEKCTLPATKDYNPRCP